MNSKAKIFLLVVIVLLVAGNIFFSVCYLRAKKDLQTESQVASKTAFNVKVVGFAKLFTAKVLSADKEIDFETRLQLENAVRAINDQEILAYWNNFTSSSNEQDAQTSVKKLLELLLNKMIL